jgi:hypothetical protein
MGVIQLKPGVDTQQTATLNSAGVTQSQLIRYKEGLIQTYGGWQPFYNTAIGSTIRDLHAWVDSNFNNWLAVGATKNLVVIENSVPRDITPQTFTSSFPPNFSISSSTGSNANYFITVTDNNLGAYGVPSIYDSVYFNTPIAIGNLFINGAYQIVGINSSDTYTIASSVAASTTINSSGIMLTFASTVGSAIVTGSIPNNNYISAVGLYEQFIAPTTVGGLTIQGRYYISSILDSTNFTITALSPATATSTATMNSSLVQVVYYISPGPTTAGGGFGTGAFGSGGFGTGSTAGTALIGTPITATDWTLDNWGEVILACPKGGAVYTWSPDQAAYNAQVIAQAPFFNDGIFISQPQQILVCYGSIQATGVQDQLIVRWSDSADFTNWAVTAATAAGSFHISTGSQIIGGMQCPTFGLISTDVDVWIMQYVGGTVIFNFTRVGAGCGWIGPHAAGIMAGNPYWCGLNNFYTIGPNGVMPLPCSVWDVIFQNISSVNQTKVVCAINSAFSEVTWFYPSAASLGENDSYVKVHIEGQEYEWDFGSLARTAWIDISALGMPIASDNNGYLYQHEMGTVISGIGAPYFRSGWWALTEGQDLAFVDWILPDFIWGTYGGAKDASVNVTFYSANYPGDTPLTYGPYTVTSATEYINIRLRARLMSVLVQSNNQEFWRLGRIRFRYAVSGRR